MTLRQVGSVLWPKLDILQVYGANTGVGKTIFSTILCRAFQRHKRYQQVFYLKPVSTGPLDEADDHHVRSLGRDIKSNCLFQFDEPVSPHIAVRSSSKPVSDALVQVAVRDELQKYASLNKDGRTAVILETAGGVLSPSPSGSSQADLYRPLRLPVFLVGDHQLGGIGTTISAYESLKIRGYDVNCLALFAEDRYDNHTYLKQYFADRGIHAFSIPPPPDRLQNPASDAEAMRMYYQENAEHSSLLEYGQHFLHSQENRIDKLQNLPRDAHESIWHPFLQHTERKPDNITATDSAYGDYFQTFTTAKGDKSSTDDDTSMLKPAFDGSASWWTQGLGHGNPELALTAAHAAGRYGHVMFASAIHEPALDLAHKIKDRMGNRRLEKVFFTDNGSTGMEVAVKMALRASAVRNGWNSEKDEIVILGLTNSYHGDTMGTMDCSEPSIFNKKVEWYNGRGHWIDFPRVHMQKGRWKIEMPTEASGALGETRDLAFLDEVFDITKRKDDWDAYQKYCTKILDQLQSSGKKLGALVMEPILLGAGGMFFADPLFQKALVHSVRQSKTESDSLDWHGMPVIFDEVFTGMYRLGRFNAGSMLGVDPDIVVNAKLLTGGLLPLCTTTASNSIYEAFLSSDKTDALLHGHSYTAHPVGCAVANQSLDIMAKLDTSEDWTGFREDWKRSGNEKTWSMWSNAFVSEISHKPNVGYVFAIGSVLAISVKDPAGGSGYASTAAIGLRDKLLAGVDGEEWVIHSRVLGNVLYLMAAMTTEPHTLQGVQGRVLEAL